MFADAEAAEAAEDDEEDEDMDGEDETAAGDEEAVADEEGESTGQDMEMDEEGAGEDEQKQAEDVDEEVFVNPSPIRTRNNRNPRSPSLSISTTKPSTTKPTQPTRQQQPLLTPSRAQRKIERKKPTKQAAEEEKVADDAMEAEDEGAVSEPDSPAKNTRSHRTKAPVSVAPPVAAVTTPRRSARAKSAAMEQQAGDSSGSVVRTRARRK